MSNEQNKRNEIPAEDIGFRARANSKPCADFVVAELARWLAGSLRLLNRIQFVRNERVNRLHLAGWPADHGSRYMLDIFPKSKVKPAIILRREAASARDLLNLLLIVPRQLNLRANRTAIAHGSLQVEFNPVISRRYRVFIQEQRPALVGNNYIQNSAIPQVSHRDGTSVIGIRDTDSLRNIDKLAGSIIQPYMLLLIAGKASAVHRRPVFGVSDDRGISASDLREVIPIALGAVERNVAVRQVEIKRAIIIQVAELRAKAPPSQFNPHIPCQVFKRNRTS